MVTAAGLGEGATFRDGPVGAEGELQGSQAVALLRSSLSEQDKAVARVAQVTVLGQCGRDASDFAHEAGLVNRVERALQVHGENVSSFVVAVAL